MFHLIDYTVFIRPVACKFKTIIKTNAPPKNRDSEESYQTLKRSIENTRGLTPSPAQGQGEEPDFKGSFKQCEGGGGNKPLR